MSIDLRELIKHESDYIGKDVMVEGWIRTLRDSKAFGFIELTDGTSFKTVQVVMDNDLENFSEVIKYPISTAIRVFGTVVASPGAKQSFEIKAKNLHITLY